MDIFTDRAAMAQAIMAAAARVQETKQALGIAVAVAEANSQALNCAVRDIINDYADDPKKLGANDAARTAVIEGRTMNERLALHNAEMDRRTAVTEADCAEVEWRSLRAAAAILYGGEVR